MSNINTSSIEPWLGKEFVCSCGKKHSIPLQKVAIGERMIQQIPEYCKNKGFTSITLVADNTTYLVAGSAIQLLLEEHDIQVHVSIIEANELGDVTADEPSIVQVILDMPPAAQAMLAVGSGTIHDIVRFVSYKTGCAFISVPTAPSVDGFASVGAPLLLRGFKQTIPAWSPEAIFADLSILCKAPQTMIAAGFGDMLGKYTSMADWQLGRVLFQEHYCPVAAEMTYAGLQKCMDHIKDISDPTPQGMAMLMEGLILSGISMLMVGNSRPASGAEHHLSHYWEMKLLQEHRKALLHGAKVGVACIIMAESYESIKLITKEEAQSLLDLNSPPSEDEDRKQIKDVYGKISEQVLEENYPANALSNPADDQQSFKAKILHKWDEIIQIAERVPSPEQLTEWLEAAGGPSQPEQLGISPELVYEAQINALFVRNRFTILRLLRWL